MMRTIRAKFIEAQRKRFLKWEAGYMVAILSLLLFYNTLANKGETIYAKHQGLLVGRLVGAIKGHAQRVSSVCLTFKRSFWFVFSSLGKNEPGWRAGTRRFNLTIFEGMDMQINRNSIFYKIHPFFLILSCLPIFYYKTSSLIIGYFFTVIFLYSCGMILIFIYDFIISLRSKRRIGL